MTAVTMTALALSAAGFTLVSQFCSAATALALAAEAQAHWQAGAWACAAEPQNPIL